MVNLLGTGRIWKLPWILLALISFVPSPPASPLAGNPDMGNTSQAAISGQEAKNGSGTRKPGKIIIVYTGDLQGNMGPCG